MSKFDDMSGPVEVLVLYYSSTGHVDDMARHVARGVNSVKGCAARLRTVSSLHDREIANDRPPLVVSGDLTECAGLILGSPARFGNMAAVLKQFLENTTDLWVTGALVNKPAAVFTSAGSMHGGQESTLLSMALPLLHHGMILVGLSYDTPELGSTMTGGTPYGASHNAGMEGEKPLSDDERILCYALGKRLAEISRVMDGSHLIRPSMVH